MTNTLERIEFEGPVGPLVAWDSGPGNDELVPVVFVHGINGSAADWLPLVELFESDRRVLTLDLRGHGESDASGPFSSSDYADDVGALLNNRGIVKAHIVGTSFGCSVAVTLAAQQSGLVASLVALGGALHAEGGDVDEALAVAREVGTQQFFEMFLGQASFAPGTDPGLIAATAARASHRPLEVIGEVTRAAFADDVTERAAQSSAPALVATGEFDLTCPVVAGEQLAAALGTAHHVISGSGHMAVLEDPDAVVKLIAPFLRTHDHANSGR